MVAHPGWILEKAMHKLSPKNLCSHLESPCSTRAALAVLGYLWFSSAETHRLSGSDEQRHSFLTTVISALLYHYFHQVTLPWSTCLAFHSFPSKARVSLTQVLKCYLLYTAWSHLCQEISIFITHPCSSLGQLWLCHWRVTHSLRVYCQVLCC